MALFEWTRTGYGRTWGIEIGTGTSADLLVKKWPVLEFVKRPTRKDVGVYPRKLTIPIVDYDSTNGYLRDAVFDSELECELSLNSDVIFSGVIYQSDIIKAVGEDEYDTQVIVSDGLERLKRSGEFSGTYTYEEFLKELLWESGFELDIHFYTDWEEDNASAGLVDKHRLTYQSDNYMDVLQKFCKDFGYQVYQEDNVWVVRSLAYFAGGSVTRYVITGDGTTSASVDLTESITGLYKSTDEDIIRGTGTVLVNSSWEKFDQTFSNGTFEQDFDGWDHDESISEAGVLDTNGQFMSQNAGKIFKYLDEITFNIQADIRCAVDDGFETARWAQIIFTQFTGEKYYLQANGTFSSSEAFIETGVSAPPVIGEPTSVTFNETVNLIGSPLPIGPQRSAFKAEIRLTFDSEAGFFSSFTYTDVDVSVNERTQQRTQLKSLASGGGPGRNEIEISTIQNNLYYIEFVTEYLSGSNWRSTEEFGGESLSGKRAKDEVIVRNINMEMIRAEMDFSDYKGLTKIYADGGKEFIPLASKITIGLDDVEVTFIRHERSSDVISVSDEFS